MERLDRITTGDRLNGSEEPSMSEYAKRDARKASGVEKIQQALFADDADIHESLVSEIAQIIEAFSKTNRGYSVDRLIADPILNEDFQLACDRLSVPGTPAERNRFLFRIRKAGKLKAASVDTTVRTKIGWSEVSPFLFASEIAWRQIVNKYCMSLDEIFCDPRVGVQFDAIAAGFAPGYQSLDYRWAALKLRKEGSNAKHRATLRTPKQFGISALSKKKLKSAQGTLISELDLDVIPEGPGVYVIRKIGGDALYAGETSQLASQISRTFGKAEPREMWLKQFNDLELLVHPVSTVADYRFARQSVLLKWHRPAWNTVKELAG